MKPPRILIIALWTVALPVAHSADSVEAPDRPTVITERATAKSGDDTSLDEIMVTATRRSEEISKVPISIVALNQAALEDAGIKTFNDLAAYVPGVEFDTAAGFGPNTITNVAIRGVNSNIGTSTTGIYLDDVPIQTRIDALSYWGNPFPLLFDVDHVEVDRGPQGTLFGAGAEGGALRMVSSSPRYDEYHGFAHAELASTEGGALSYEEGGAVGGPIVPDTDRVIATMTEYAPNFARSIVGRSVLSPLDLEREYGLIGGDIFHGSLHLDQIYSLRPAAGYADYRTPIKGLYMCGSGTHPGGGVSGIPGRNSSREIMRDMRRRKVSSKTKL